MLHNRPVSRHSYSVPSLSGRVNRSVIFGITTIEGSISAFQLRDDEPRSGLWGRHSMMILGFVLLPSKRSYFSLDLLCLATIQADENKSESNAIYPNQNRRTDPEELVEQTYPRTEMPRFSIASPCRSEILPYKIPRLRKRRISTPIYRRRRLNMARSYTRSTIVVSR